MDILRRILATALAAGILAGLAITVFQHFSTAPLILNGEVYEEQAAASMPATHDHEGVAAWEPRNGFERTAYSFLANLLTGVGFALVLTSLYVLRGRPVTWREGLLWGLAGFVVVALAPGLGLPPELPGMPASALGPRQTWWVATALLTAIGLALVFLRRDLWAVVLGVALIVAPHLWGAPPPMDEPSTVPASLEHSFIVAVTISTFLFWVVLGALSGAFYRRFGGSAA
ncbi:cobalt transporter subunit CbtA [Arboricoccus pini]|uniref:Cobalt transporter subunit CbtA n=1 Tax=Arboricoccus pini TaxID=1963835 RepID=A0A212QR89_9PROT|nr:CbtA family protein [Arboricoccus pini]SNB62098.1 cobalt transporter subunit CbtA [Arboricoccus pini]